MNGGSARRREEPTGGKATHKLTVALLLAAKAHNPSPGSLRRPTRPDTLGARADPDVPKGEGMPQPTTEITVLGGDRYRVQGEAKDVERQILAAARGAIMELAWLIEVDTGERIGVNPECVVMLQATDGRDTADEPPDGATGPTARPSAP